MVSTSLQWRAENFVLKNLFFSWAEINTNFSQNTKEKVVTHEVIGEQQEASKKSAY
jgi:hypothetical protein